MGAAGFKEVEGAVDIGGDEVARTGDAPINVRLGSEVHDVRDVMLADDAEDFFFIAGIDLLKDITRMNAMDAVEIFKMTGIGEAVEIDELCDLGQVNDLPDETGADEACTTGNEEVHIVLRSGRFLISWQNKFITKAMIRVSGLHTMDLS